MDVKQDISDISDEDWKMEDRNAFSHRTKIADTTPSADNISRNHDENKAGWLVMIQMSVFMLVLIYISGKVWVRCRERWEFHWPYRCFRCCTQSNDARDDNDDDFEADVLCYLCNKKVPSDEWNNSETGHRRYCAVRSKDNRDLLADMPHANVPCRICRKGLRIWPLTVGPPFFYCRETTCKFGGKEILNNSANRYNCYACDFDLCRDCGISQIRKAGQQKRSMFKENKPQSYDVKLATTPLQRPKRGLVGSPGECKFFVHHERRDKVNVPKTRVLSQLSDPLRRKVYDPKIVAQENTNEEIVAQTNDKVSQLSLTFRKETIFVTKDANSEDGIEDDNIELYAHEASKRGRFKSHSIEESNSPNKISNAGDSFDEIPVLKPQDSTDVETLDILSPNGTEDTIIED